MHDERSEPARASWRRNAAPPPPRREPEKPEWSRRRLKPVEGARGPRFGSFKIVAAVLGFLACLVAVVVLIILIWPPDPVGILLVGADYADNLAVPHNVLGWKGLEGIAAVARTPRRRALFRPGSLQLIGTPQVIDQPERWDRVIDELATKGFSQPTILIAVALHGGSDPDGAYLIPDNMGQPGERLDLAKVIESMNKLPKTKQKVLILEPAQASENWRLGMLHNDFAGRLERLEPEIRKIDNLWVLSACDVDQRCWASEGLGRTVFSHFLIEGLRGKAAGPDGQLTLAGLHKYVRDSVRDWVWDARGAIQEPVLLPRPVRVTKVGEADEESKAEEATAKVAARKPANRVILVSVENAAEPEAPAPPDLETVRREWRGFHRLDAMVPHPSAYSPRRWREYRAALVRYEELVRAGGAGRAGPVRERIDALARRIEGERMLRGLSQSAENSLAMKLVAGGRLDPASPSAAPEEFLRFWNAPTGPDAAKLWDAMAAGDSPVDDPRPSLRIRVDDFLHLRATDDPVKNLKIAADRLLITSRKGGLPQPAEAHFLRMMANWPDALTRRPPPVWALAAQALTVRRLAERAAVGAPANPLDHSYSEQVHPWIRSQIEAADRQRRLGEDLFFSSEKAAWDRSERALDQARRLYQDALRRAGIVQAALSARDRSLAILPEYSRWIAHRYSDELEDTLPATLQDLWEKTHAMAARLEKPQADGDLGWLAQAAKALSDRRDALSRSLVEQVDRIDAGRSREDWQAATAAAAVPFPDSDDLALRARLWARLDNIRDHDRDPSSGDANPAPLSDEDGAQQSRHARRRAQIQGLMALSALGAGWFDDEATKARGEGDFQATMERVRRVSEMAPGHAGAWRKEPDAAGGLIGHRWQKMAPIIDQLKSEEGGVSDLRAFEDRLTRADRLGRQIDGGAPPLEENAVEAAARLRQARVHDLLLTLAERARLDHWYGEDPDERPYYHVVGSRFVADASSVFRDSPPARATQGRLDEKGSLEISGRPRLVLTSERSAGLAYKVVATGPVPEGLPVVRPVPDRLLELQGDAGGFRAVERGDGNERAEFFVGSPLINSAETDARRNRPIIEPAELRVEGSFRGQPLTSRTEMQLHPVPDTVAIGPPPPRPQEASLAVRASQEIIDRFGEGTGSIAIVLDCSGSMLDSSGDGRRTKFDDAKRALSQVLDTLPRGTVMSLWTFSQLPEGVNQVLPNDPIAGEPELTIHQLRKPVPWDPGQLGGLVKQLDELRPFLDTPLVQAMWTAANKDLTSARGLKTLLVLTDGNDNRLAKNHPRYNPNKLSVPEFVVAGFKSLNIRVNMIFFTPSSNPVEIRLARENFEGALKQLEPAGHFVLANNLGELIATLRRGMRQRLTCEILKPPNWTPVAEEPLEVTGPGEADKWWTDGLEPGTYKLRVHADKPYEQEIDLRKGERMLVELVDGTGGGIAFRRALYGDQREFDGKRAIQDSGSWRLAVLADQRRSEGQDEQLHLFATLERKPGEPGAERLRQVEPGRPWFRVDAEDVGHPEAEFAVRWRERIFFPGPAWQLDVPRWVEAPAGGGLARPILRAWWRDAESRSIRDHEILMNPPGDPGVLPRSLEVEDGKSVTIESLVVEDHRVEVQPDQPTQVQPCLVIRLEFPRDRPYIVDPGRLAGLEIVGYEHRLYSRARKYTGLFWPVTQAKLSKLSNVGLISLGAHRDQAEKERRTAEVKLTPPREADQLPVPPPAITRER